MKKSIEGVRVIREHSHTCTMMLPRNHPDNPLYLPDEVPVIADSIGRRFRGPGWKWLRFRCNSTDCLAEVWVRADVLTKFAHRLMNKALEAQRK